MVNSKVIAVTVRPEPKVTESRLEIELAHLANVRHPSPPTPARTTDTADHLLFTSALGLTSSPVFKALLTRNRGFPLIDQALALRPRHVSPPIKRTHNGG